MTMPCARCEDRPGTERFFGSLTPYHYELWCRRCVLKAQIEHAEERAAALPGLRDELLLSELEDLMLSGGFIRDWKPPVGWSIWDGLA